MAVPIRTGPESDCSLFSMNDGCLCLPRYSALLPYLEISQKKKVKNIVYSRYSGVPSGCREAPLEPFFACVGHIIWLDVWGLGVVGGLRCCGGLGVRGSGMEV